MYNSSRKLITLTNLTQFLRWQREQCVTKKKLLITSLRFVPIVFPVFTYRCQMSDCFVFSMLVMYLSRAYPHLPRRFNCFQTRNCVV